MRRPVPRPARCATGSAARSSSCLPSKGSSRMRAAVDLAARLRRAATLRRAGLWTLGAVPWLLLRSGPGLLAWSAFCAWDGLHLQRRVAHGWAQWLDDAVPELEDSAALLAHAPESP